MQTNPQNIRKTYQFWSSPLAAHAHTPCIVVFEASPGSRGVGVVVHALHDGGVVMVPAPRPLILQHHVAQLLQPVHDHSVLDNELYRWANTFYNFNTAAS